MSENHQPNPNTPENWDQRWKDIGLVQTDDASVQQRLTRVAQLVPEKATVIDLAAGPGLIRHKLRNPARYLPVDFSTEALNLSGVLGIVANCVRVPVPDHSFHTVLCMEIIEHMDNPRPLIIEAIRIARFQIIVTVPNDRLPPEQFAYHRRTWDHNQLSFFLRSFDQIVIARFIELPANIVAACSLR